MQLKSVPENHRVVFEKFLKYIDEGKEEGPRLNDQDLKTCFSIIHSSGFPSMEDIYNSNETIMSDEIFPRNFVKGDTVNVKILKEAGAPF